MTKGNLNNLDKSFVQNLSNNWALVTSGASDNYLSLIHISEPTRRS